MRIVLTKPDGKKFEINPKKIDALEEASPGVWAPGVNTIIYSHEFIRQGVKETVDQIKKMESANEAKRALYRTHQPPRETA